MATIINGIPNIVVYFIPIVILIIGVFLWWRKSHRKVRGENTALIYSVLRRSIVNVRTFTLDAQKSKAYFPPEIPPKMSLNPFRRKPDISTQEHADFSPMMAVYNVKAHGYFTIFTEELKQAPLISGDSYYLNKIVGLEKNVERRVSRLNACSLAIQAYVNTSAPKENFGRLEVLNIILIFVALLAIAYAISSVTSSVTSLGTLLKGLHVITNSTT